MQSSKGLRAYLLHSQGALDDLALQLLKLRIGVQNVEVLGRLQPNAVMIGAIVQ
jgi:hypothetical protein